MKRQEKIAALIGDILIPILGFFLWDWSIYFICLFFLLDQLSREVSHLFRMRYLKSRFQIRPISYLRNILIFIGFVTMVHVYNYMLHPTINFAREMTAFFWYKDTGIVIITVAGIARDHAGIRFPEFTREQFGRNQSFWSRAFDIAAFARPSSGSITAET